MPDPALLPPLLVLSSHRSGSSAFMGMLVAAGLEVGPVLPPAPDNPRGFFENRAVVEVDKQLLSHAGRDWTCPPAHLDVTKVPLEEMRAALDTIDRTRPWGIKDPRLLFTATAWMAALDGEVRLVGVHRRTEAVARSLAARGSLRYDQAFMIANAYAERLAEIQRILGFPVVCFDDERAFAERTGRVAELLGLEVHGDLGASIDPQIVHHRDAETETGFDRELERAATESLDLRLYTRATVRRVFGQSPARAAASLATRLGPAETERRSVLQRWAQELLSSTPVLATIDPVGSPQPPLEAATSSPIPWLAGDPGRLDISGAAGAQVVIGPSALDDVPPSGLGAFLDDLETALDDTGTAMLGVWLTDSPSEVETLRFRPDGVIASRSAAPFLHRRDELEIALAPRPFRLVRALSGLGGRTDIVITRSADLAPDASCWPVSKLSEAFLSASTELEQVSSELSSAISELDLITKQTQDRQLALDQSQALVERTRAELRDRVRELDERRRRDDELAATTEEQAAQLQELRSAFEMVDHQARHLQYEIDRLRGRRSVRVALGAASLARPAFRSVRRVRRDGLQIPQVRDRISQLTSPYLASRRTEQLRRAIAERRPLSPAPATGPLVSIVVLTRNGAHHLETLLPALERTTYEPFEVVVVDNGSSDSTAEVLARPWRFPVVVVRQERNTSFSEGNNIAVRDHARGDLLLFLNNDTEPLRPDWLATMVAALSEGVAAVGALLVYPVRGDAASDLTVQHTGVSFGFRDGSPHAMNVGASDPLDESLRLVHPVPAATAAGLLVRSRDFLELGGFDQWYVYGTEDVDLCLKLRSRGDVVVAGDAVLFHNEHATQIAETREVAAINREGNWRHFAEIWAPTLSRSIRRCVLAGEQSWVMGRRRRVAITLTDNDRAKGWGDWYTAHELGDAFESEGWEVFYAERFEDHWYELPENIDLLVSLIDAYDVRRAPEGVFTIAWVRNWVERWMSRDWFDSFDLVVTSSTKSSDVIAEASGRRPPVLPLASNADRFAPGPPDPTFRCDFAFTGNNWGGGRDLIPLLDVRGDEKFLLFGKNWDLDPRMGRYWRGHLDYRHLSAMYRSARIVLDDTAGPTLPHAFVNGRVFDALAAGSLVLTDNVEGSDELFDGRLPTYADRFELRRKLDEFLADESAREALARELRQIVVDNHTYAHRARQFPQLAIEELDRPRIAIRTGVPSFEEAPMWGDTHFANALASGLRREGFATEVQILPEWSDPAKQAVDVVIHLRGLSAYAPLSSQLNVLWVISHPDEVSPEECDKYDLVLVASPSMAKQLQAEVAVPVHYLPQATDGRRFGAVISPGEAAVRAEVLFVGNSRGQDRNAVKWAIAAGLDLTVIGKGWEKRIPESLLQADHVDNRELPALYSSAGVVLNDHWADMARHGMVSNRVFDVLAAGGVVVSDVVAGLDDLFGDIVPTYRDADELGLVVRQLLSDDSQRAKLADRGRELVMSAHTFEHRSKQISNLIWPLLEGRPADCEGNLFERPVS